MKRSKHDFFVFPPKKTLVWRRHCWIGQSCCSMTSERRLDWFLESRRAWSFPTQAFDKLIKSFYFRSFVVSVLFARFHYKVIRKSLKQWTRTKVPKKICLLYKHQWNTRWAFSRKLDIFTCENNMLSSHVKISPMLWLHNKSRLSHQKTIQVKWFCISLVFI